jgi:hypothetical protein
MTTSGANGYLQRIKCVPARAEVRHAHAEAPDTLQFMSGAPPVIQAGPASELQWSEPNVRLTWLAHRTVRCTIRHTASTQTASLVVGAINTPNHPTFKSSKFSHFNYLQEL